MGGMLTSWTQQQLNGLLKMSVTLFKWESLLVQGTMGLFYLQDPLTSKLVRNITVRLHQKQSISRPAFSYAVLKLRDSGVLDKLKKKWWKQGKKCEPVQFMHFLLHFKLRTQ